MQIAKRIRREAASRASAAASAADVEDDDPLPTPPLGFEIVDWAVGDSVEHFLSYCKVARQVARWHVGIVDKPVQHRVYTHDAFLDGTKQKRGVILTAQLYDHIEGRFWHKLSPVSASVSA